MVVVLFKETLACWFIAVLVTADKKRAIGSPTVQQQQQEKQRQQQQRQIFTRNPMRAGLSQSMVADKLRVMALNQNKLIGTMPSDFFSLWSLFNLYMSANKISGSLPAGLGMLSKLRNAYINRNHLSNSIPDSFGCLMGLVLANMSENAFEGTFPGNAGGLRSLLTLEVARNKLTGTVPRGLAGLAHGQSLDMSSNSLQGKCPKLSGPWDRVWIMANKLSGALPTDLFIAGRLSVLTLSQNSIAGTLPDAMLLLRQLGMLWIQQNKLAGTLPECFRSMPSVSRLLFTENMLSGTLPVALCELKKMINFDLGKNMWEGAVPPCFARLSKLILLSVAGHRGSGLHGSIPSKLGKTTRLWFLAAQGHSFQGAVPAFRSSFKFLGVHTNELDHLPALCFQNYAMVFLQYNLVSCKLSPHKVQHLVASLVAVGNHFLKPSHGAFPAMVSPFERDSMLWVESKIGVWFVLKVLSAWAFLGVACRKGLDASRYLAVASMWTIEGNPHQRSAVRLSSMLNVMKAHVAGGCVLLLLVLDAQHYMCPGLTQTTACLSKRSLPQITVVILWGHLCSEARHPDWSQGAVALPSAKHVWCWVHWIALVVVCSQLAVLSLTAKCVPSFLPMEGNIARFLNLGVGACQGLINGLVIPPLATKMAYIPKATLASFAGVLSGCLLPGLVVFYLDGRCLDRWAAWWRPCREGHGHFDVWVRMAAKNDVEHVKFFSQTDMCEPDFRQFSAATCSRSIARKLENLLIDKLVMAVIFLPAGRLIIHKLYKTDADMRLRLAFLLQMCMFLGPSLPLLGPILWLGVLAVQQVFAASCDQGTLKMQYGEQETGSFGVSFAIALACSSLFYYSFVSEYAVATFMLLLIVATIVPLTSMKEVFKRLPRCIRYSQFFSNLVRQLSGQATRAPRRGLW